MMNSGGKQWEMDSSLVACISVFLFVYIYKKSANRVASAARVRNLADRLNIYSKISCSLLV